MKIHIVTLFPNFFNEFLKTSIIGRAITQKKVDIKCWDFREFSDNKHHKVDDVPYGGGHGMLLQCQPIFDCIHHIKSEFDANAKVLFFSAHGKVWNQSSVEKYTEHIINEKGNQLILLCGHYEGVDQRVLDLVVDEEISIGEFILTGGEIPAQVFLDSVIRCIPSVLGHEKSSLEESFSDALDGKLEYPQYTRPEVFREKTVPEILLSGHHANIEKWKKRNCR